MGGIRVLHTADCHLGAPLANFGEYADQRREELLATFLRIVKRCRELEAHVFLVAGDLFDSNNPEDSLISSVREALQRLSSEGTHVVLLPGNHDTVADPESVYLRKPFPGCHLIKPAFTSPLNLDTPGGPVLLYAKAGGIGAGRDESLEVLRRTGEKGFHLGVLHASLAGNPEWETKSHDIVITRERIVELGLDFLALGHYHRRDVIREGDRILASYPGSPEGRNFEETGERTVNLITWEHGRVSLSEVPVQTRILKTATLDVTPLGDAGSVEEAVRNLADPDLILRIALAGTPEEVLDARDIRARIAGLFAHLEIRDETEFLDLDRIRVFTGERSVRGIFVSKVLQRLQDLRERGETEGDEARALKDAVKYAFGEFQRAGIRSGDLDI